MPDPNNISSQSGQISKDFQLSNDVKAKGEMSFGLGIAQYIQATLGGNSSYYFIRNSRFAKNRSMVNGRYDMSTFMDRAQLNAKFNYVNINWLPFHIVQTIISRKVGAWMQRNEKIDVSAIDAGSEKQKRDLYEQMEFALDHKEQLLKLQEASGVQMLPPNLPQDKDELDMWARENNRLPEEIKAETGINSIMSQEGLFTVLKEKLLHDSGVVGLVALYSWMDDKGQIHDEYVKPENAIYSYSDFPDFRDTTWRGRIVSRKISEIRRKYSVEFGGKMSEEELFALAQFAKEYQVPDKIRWLSEWSTSMLRPYDEWNLDVIEFAWKSLDSDGFKMKVTQSGSLIVERSGKFDNSENKEYVADDGWNMYWGAYVRDADKMLEWGLMKNQIKSQDVKEIGNVEFPFSFYMYQNQDMRNLAIPEKIEKPFEQMMLVLLKMEQLISKLRPIGAMVNVNAIRELDLGLANLTKPLEVQRLYDQTGMLYYTDKDAEGNPIGTPITELANAGFRDQSEGLVRMYQFWYQSLKDELGEDPNLAQQATQPRVTEGNVQTSIEQADNATDYMYSAYLHVMEDAARKNTCLMHDSISFGAKAYRHILGEEEVEGKVFTTKVSMLPQDRQIAILEQQINQAIASNQDLVMYLNTFKILRIAREDVKLAEEYFRIGMKRMLQSKLDQTREAQESTFKSQLENGKQIEKEKRTSMQIEVQTKGAIEMATSKERQKELVISGIFGMREKGIPLGAWEAVEQEIIHNVGMPLFAENVANAQAMADQAHPQQESENEEQPMQEQPIMQSA